MPEPNNRIEQELAYVSHLFEGIDKNIEIPESLSSRALLHKLDDARPERRRDPHFWGFFSLQSGISYAIAFALVVAVFYAVRLGSPGRMIDGSFIVEGSEGAGAATVANGDVAEASPEISAFMLDEDAAAPEIEPFAARSNLIDPVSDSPESAGIGGANPVNLLGESGAHLLAWRLNDPSDPDHTGEITFEVLERDGNAVVAWFDISGMSGIDLCHIDGDNFFLIDITDSQTIIHGYSGLESLNLVQTGTLVQSGIYMGSRVYQGYLHVAAMSAGLPDDTTGLNIAELTDSAEDGICYIAAISATTGEFSVTALKNSAGNIIIYDNYAELYYSGNDGQLEPLIARITLDQLNVTMEA